MQALSVLQQRSRGLLSLRTRSVPSMISPEEKEMLAFLAEHVYSGEGVIVDAGIFLGSSTLSLAEGLRRNRSLNKAGQKPIQSFELGICDHYMAATVNQVYSASLKIGESFMPYTYRHLAGIEDLVELHVGDITQQRFDAPVEIFSYDCGKSPAIDEFCVNTIFPKLIPGKSIVVQQDYYHEWCPWIHVNMGQRWGQFQYLCHFATSAVFLCTAAIAANAYALWQAIEIDRALQLAEICNSITGDDTGLDYMLGLGRCVLAGEKGHPALGLKMLRDLPDPDETTTIGFKLPGKQIISDYLTQRMNQAG